MAMDHDTLVRMLDKTPGLGGSAGTYEVESDHRVTLYIGEPGHAIQVPEVRSVGLHDGFVEVRTREDDILLVRIDVIYGVGTKAETKKSRAGFS